MTKYRPTPKAKINVNLGPDRRLAGEFRLFAGRGPVFRVHPESLENATAPQSGMVPITVQILKEDGAWDTYVRAPKDHVLAHLYNAEATSGSVASGEQLNAPAAPESDEERPRDDNGPEDTLTAAGQVALVRRLNAEADARIEAPRTTSQETSEPPLTSPATEPMIYAGGEENPAEPEETTMTEQTKTDTTGAIKLTKNEQLAVTDLWYSSDGNGHDFGITDEMPSIPKKSRGGLIASLSTKGVINVGDEHRPGGNTLVQFVFTEAGRSLFADFAESPDLKESDLTAKKTAAPKKAAAAAVAATVTAPEPKAAPTPKKAPAPAPKAAPKADPKAAPKGTPAPKADAPKPAPAPRQGRPKGNGMRMPQLKILAALAKSGKWMSRKEVVEATGADNAWMTEWLGSNDPSKRAANDAKHFPSLVTLAYVSFDTQDRDGRDTTVYKITPEGRAALKTAQKAN